MSQIDNLASNRTLENLVRRVRALEFATNQNNMAIGRGGLSVYDGGVITIENGGLKITGTADVLGTLIATGVINLSGEVNISGPLEIAGETTVIGPTTITGNLDVNGPMKTTGTLSVEGVTTLKNDLNVTTGKITAGGVTLDPSHLSGSVKFSNGSYMAATPNGAQLAVAGGGAAYASAAQSGISHGGVGVAVDASGPFITGLPTTSQPANLYVDPATNRLYRSTAV